MLDQVRRRTRALRPAGPVYGRLVDIGRSLPVPAKVRVAVSTVALRRPWRVTVPVDRLLLGAQGGWTAREYATRTDDLLWPSTRLIDGPHVALLRAGEQTDAEILAGPYGQLARRCIDVGDGYFGASDDTEIVALARDFLDRYRTRAEGTHDALPAQGTRRPEQSGRMDPVLVAPVRASGYYQVLDGHHRLAMAVAEGRTHVPVVAKWLPVTTPLQDHLSQMSWLGGSRELYQPIEAPELSAGWTTVRHCTDRLTAMRSFLRSRGISDGSYLDVASCYGWFVGQMAADGFHARGIERDPLAIPLGQAVYGLPDGAIATGDAVDLLPDRRCDVVSCFSLLHHFALGRGQVSAEALIRLLDRATRQVLFLDTGQEHENWFRKSLRGWNPPAIQAFLRQHTSFDEIIDLGPDEDDRPPYSGNYGRHLFACVRAT